MREPSDAIATRNDLKAVFFEIVTDKLHDVFIVFDDEDSRLRIHGSESIAEGMCISKKMGVLLQFIHGDDRFAVAPNEFGRLARHPNRFEKQLEEVGGAVVIG
ncbi:MAG: hypothetical protein ACREDR_19515 [Blastocatellia bacterium]